MSLLTLTRIRNSRACENNKNCKELVHNGELLSQRNGRYWIAVQIHPNAVRVLTDSETILEFKCPKLVGEVLESYPGYGIFLRSHASSPLADHEGLISWRFYYLLPMEKENVVCEFFFRKQVKQVQAEENLNVKWVEKIGQS
ncbi:hypothetical protein Q3G72_024608 [Acer saccharum]|nr:hypothetical protein Q3G72_024608 [Acer saccharum]